MTVGQRIKARRKELGVSADTLAEILGISRATIFRYEKGDIEKLPVDILEPIAKALHTTPAHLMGWEEVKKNNDALADIIIELRTDETFKSIVEAIYNMDKDKRLGLLALLK